MPAWKYEHHPEGFTQYCDYWYGSPFGWAYVQFGHILMNAAYLSNDNRIHNATYAQRAELASKSILGCPGGYAPHGDNDNVINHVSDPVAQRSMMMTYENYQSHHTTPAPCGLWFKDQYPTGDSYLTAYKVNMYAGSFAFYTYLTGHSSMDQISQRFYKNSRWVSGNPPEKIGYIFEQNGCLADDVHMDTQYSLTHNS